MKKILLLLLIGIIPNLIILILLYMYDPLQLYHSPLFRKQNIIDTNMRYQAAGIINTWDFNSAIIGTSMLQNTSIYEASDKLGGTWVNLSIAAGSLYERKILLQQLLQKHKTKQIIISLEPFLFLQKQQAQHLIDYGYLYDNISINDFKLYLDENYLFCLLKISNSCLKNIDPQYPTAWFNDPFLNQTFGGIQQWIKKNENLAVNKNLLLILNPHPKNTNATCKEIENNIQTNILNIISSNPNTSFYIIFPPFSTLYYKLNATEKNWKIWKYGLNLLLKSKLQNLKVFGFDNEDFTSKIERYKDFEHYDEKVNSFMLDAIKNDTHRITLENIDSYFQAMRKKVEAYDIEPLRKQIIESGVLDKQF